MLPLKKKSCELCISSHRATGNSIDFQKCNINDKAHSAFIYLFIQHLYSALFTNKRALMRYSIIKSITKSYYSESKHMYG